MRITEAQFRSCAALLLGALFVASSAVDANAALPSVPYPPENPPTEGKRILGKALFWDEQLSSDNTTACGSCHRPAFGGVDPRHGVHPGADGIASTPDDIHGSPGVRRMDSDGRYLSDTRQLTRRTAPSIFTALWAEELFWDGRASGEFVDPENGTLRIASGGALEAQSVLPLLDTVEMAQEGRSWEDVIEKLTLVRPLALARDLPADLAAALHDGVRYPQLFEAAFGDAEIRAERIAYALADYQRTLVPDQTPWDRHDAGESAALSEEQRTGLGIFLNTGACRACHTLPLFSNDQFRNTGVRPSSEDAGRREVTGLAEDRGKFKVPSLRNVGLRPRFMHNGRFASLSQVLDFYSGNGAQQSFPDNRDGHFDVIDIPAFGRDGLLTFLRDGLTDPRVASEAFPFDRPTLFSELSPAEQVSPAAQMQIHPAVPNPSPGETTLSLSLLRPSAVELRIYSLRGRLVRQMRLPERSIGWQSLRWDGRDASGRPLASGVYLYQLSAGGERGTSRVTLLR